MDAGAIPNPAGDSLRRLGESNEPPGLYIHIPFCLSKCPYCDFYSSTDLTAIPDFLAALRREMSLNEGFKSGFDTVYIGGGTPSLLSQTLLDRLIGDILTAFTIASDAEITVEVNPGDTTAGRLTALRRAGVNRLSIGCQSFDDGALAFLGRRHRADQAVEAIHRTRDAGFENLGIDLIYGLPGPYGDAFATWLDTLRTALAFRPEHLSCYQLTVETGTPLADRVRKGEIALPDPGFQSRYFHRTAAILEEAGYRHYEVSNFAQGDRFRSRHNSKYWNHTPYLGLGPAAHSFDGRRRRWNHRSIAAYLKELAAGKPPTAESELLSDEALRLESLFLGLRTRRGIDLAGFKRRYGEDLLVEKEEILKKLKEDKFVEIRNGFLMPTRAGMAVADSLALI
ncbi:MAG: radical SAM family heme chaperone HemW [Deltaproteobacteria bacterium]|nr:radical SAM family heme chaperone HemW [Deltaproteobacteria bacterium]